VFFSLKKAFAEHKNTMSQTGHGLILNGHEDTITPGSEIANAWGMWRYILFTTHAKLSTDAVKTVFPWYRRMALLIGGSPVVDRSAVANSATAVDLSVLQDDDGIEQSNDQVHNCCFVLLQVPIILLQVDYDNMAWDIEDPDFILPQDEDEGIGLDDSSQIDPPSPSHETPIDPSLQSMATDTESALAPSQESTPVHSRPRASSTPTTTNGANTPSDSTSSRTTLATNRSRSNTVPSSMPEPPAKRRKLSMAESLQETIATYLQARHSGCIQP
jgi:hypothetical protein